MSEFLPSTIRSVGMSTFISPNGDRMFTGHQNGHMLEWYIPSNRDESVTATKYIPNAHGPMVTEDKTQQEQIYSDRTDMILKVEKGTRDKSDTICTISSIALIPSEKGDRIITGGADGVVCCWDAPSPGQTGWSNQGAASSSPLNRKASSTLVKTKSKSPLRTPTTPPRNKSPVRGASFKEGGSRGKSPPRSASSTHLHSPEVMALPSMTLLAELGKHKGPVTGVVAVHNKKEILAVSSGVDTLVKVWSLDNQTLKQTLRGHMDRVWCLGCAPGCSFLLSGSLDSTIRVYEITSKSFNHVKTLKGHKAPVKSIKVCPLPLQDKHVAITGSEDCSVRVYSLGEQISLLTSIELTLPVSTLTAIPAVGGGMFIVTGNDDGYSHGGLEVWGVGQLSTTAKKGNQEQVTGSEVSSSNMFEGGARYMGTLTNAGLVPLSEEARLAKAALPLRSERRAGGEVAVVALAAQASSSRSDHLVEMATDIDNVPPEHGVSVLDKTTVVACDRDGRIRVWRSLDWAVFTKPKQANTNNEVVNDSLNAANDNGAFTTSGTGISAGNGAGDGNRNDAGEVAVSNDTGEGTGGGDETLTSREGTRGIVVAASRSVPEEGISDQPVRMSTTTKDLATDFSGESTPPVKDDPLVAHITSASLSPPASNIEHSSTASTSHSSSSYSIETTTVTTSQTSTSETTTNVSTVVKEEASESSKATIPDWIMAPFGFGSPTGSNHDANEFQPDSYIQEGGVDSDGNPIVDIDNRYDDDDDDETNTIIECSDEELAAEGWTKVESGEAQFWVVIGEPELSQLERPGKGTLAELRKFRDETLAARAAAKALKKQKKAEEAARLRAEEEALQAEKEARLKAEEDARFASERAARLRAEEEVRIAAELEARLKAEEEARLAAEKAARLKAEEEARIAAELEARLKAEEEARLAAEKAARLKAEEEARLLAEKEAQLKAEEEARLAAEKEARLKAEQLEEARRIEEARLKRQEEEAAAILVSKAEAQDARLRAESEAEDARLASEAAAAQQRLKDKIAAHEARLKAEADAVEAQLEQQAKEAEERLHARIKAKEVARLKAEEEARLAAEEEEALRKAQEEARAAAERAAKLKAEEEARLLAEQKALLKAQEEARAAAERAAKLKAEEEARLLAEQEALLKAQEEARAAAERAARLKAEEEAHLEAQRQAKLKAEEEARIAFEKEQSRIKADQEARAKQIEYEAKLEKEHIEGISSGQYCDCDNFRLDVTAAAGGTCVCGHMKVKHSPFALKPRIGGGGGTYRKNGRRMSNAGGVGARIQALTDYIAELDRKDLEAGGTGVSQGHLYKPLGHRLEPQVPLNKLDPWVNRDPCGKDN